MFDIFCYGAISLDVSGRLERPMREYGQATAIDYCLSPGGDATLVAITLSGLGLEVALSGTPPGEDPMGDYVLEMIEKEGVKVNITRAGKTSIAAIVLDRGRRSIITFHDNTPEEEIPIPEDALISSRYVYVDGCFGRNSAVIARLARPKGITSLLNLDIPSIPNIGLFDIIIANETISKCISSEPGDAARKIHEINGGIAIVTLGEKGCICYDDRLYKIPSFDVETVDSTGAGAAFAAGLIYAAIEGEPLKARLEFASATGAYKTQYRGSYIKFKKENISGFIKRHKK